MAVPPVEPLRRAPAPPVAAVSRTAAPHAIAAQAGPSTRKVRAPVEPPRADPAAPVLFEAPPAPPQDVQDAPTRHERVAERVAPVLQGMPPGQQPISPATPSVTRLQAVATPDPLRFPETDWFARPPSPDDIDPVTGRVLVDTSVYRRKGVTGGNASDDV
jgi:hypothetical protein